jgi:hypothetical protein
MSSAMDVDDQPVEQVPSPAPQEETKGKGRAKDLDKKRFEVKKVSSIQTLLHAVTIVIIVRIV